MRVNGIDRIVADHYRSAQGRVHFINVSLYEAVEPTPGEHCLMALPHLNSLTFQRWVDGFGDAFPESYNIVVLDHSAFHKAKAVQWPSNVVPRLLPHDSPEFNPNENATPCPCSPHGGIWCARSVAGGCPLRCVDGPYDGPPS
jgi:hypothetical protein